MTDHIPVMLEEVISGIKLHEGDKVIDCTLGGGGYTWAISEAIGAKGRVAAIDLDDVAIDKAETKIKNENKTNIVIVKDNFRNISDIARKTFGDGQIDAIVMDLGLSSMQLDDPERGFSFRYAGDLDMSFDRDGITTKQIINSYKEAALAAIIKNYGEEPFARLIAKAIVFARKSKRIEKVDELVDVISGVIPNRLKQPGKIHFATKTFQALRIATNDELGSLEIVLRDGLDLLKPGGRMAVVSFHSLEDRIVKDFFRQESKDCLCPSSYPTCQCDHKARLKLVTKKPLTASEQEIAANPRARSAKLRIIEKI